MVQEMTIMTFRKLHPVVIGACLLLPSAHLSAAEDPSAQMKAAGHAIEVESVVLRLFDEAEVPAQEAGLVTGVAVREGQRVKQGELLAQLDDQVPQLAADAAKAKYDITREKATNDVKIRYAQKALEVSEAELRRSTESIEKFAKSVSQSQLDVEQLTVQKNRLEAEEAEHEQGIATLEMKAQENELSAARAQIARRKIISAVRRHNRAGLSTKRRMGRAGAKSAPDRERGSTKSRRIHSCGRCGGGNDRQECAVDRRLGRQSANVPGQNRFC